MSVGQEITSIEINKNIVKCKCNSCTTTTEETIDSIVIKTVNCEKCLAFLKKHPKFDSNGFSFGSHLNSLSIIDTNFFYDSFYFCGDITNLKLINCNNIICANIMSKNLQNVTIENCENLYQFSSLTAHDKYKLKIVNCPKLCAFYKQNENHYMDYTYPYLEQLVFPKK